MSVDEIKNRIHLAERRLLIIQEFKDKASTYEIEMHKHDIDVLVKQLPNCKPHHWDISGERCLKCGDKDWMT